MTPARLLAIPVLALTLWGCSTVIPWIDKSVEDVRAAKDAEATLLLAGQCAAGRGATNRMFKDSPAKLAAIDLLCDGPDPGRRAPRLDVNTLDAIQLILGLSPAAVGTPE